MIHKETKEYDTPYTLRCARARAVVRIIDEHHARTTTTSASGSGSARLWDMLLE